MQRAQPANTNNKQQKNKDTLATYTPLLILELSMCRACRMQDGGARISEVCNMGEQPRTLNDTFARVKPSRHTKREQRTRAFWHVSAIQDVTSDTCETRTLILTVVA